MHILIYLPFEQGEIFCLLGANGAGKTTTINILLDFIPPTSGHAFINGHDCNTFPPEAKKYVSYVSEKLGIAIALLKDPPAILMA